MKADGSAVESVVHITMPANDLMRYVHNTGNNPHRMPVILRQEDQAAWLSGSAEEAWAVLNPYAADLMDAHEVSTAVNSPRNNRPSNIEPSRAQGPTEITTVEPSDPESLPMSPP